ncbi:hypothetical protein Hte_001537 [Hypoxylon texense]
MSTDDSRAPTPPNDESELPEQEHHQSEFPRVIIDPDGDLCLVVGDEDGYTFVVCSKTVARASLVWKKLLYGNFAESLRPTKDSGKEWIVRLPDDNPRPMRVLLNIIHSRFDQVPINVGFDNPPTDGSRMTFDDLFLLTVLTDKYDLTRNLRPWVRNWLNDIGNGPLAIDFAGFRAADMDRLFWIAWELGNEEFFIKAIEHVAQYSIKVRGKLKQDVDGPELFSLGYEPADISSKLFFSI